MKRRRMTSHLQRGQEGHEEDRAQGERVRGITSSGTYAAVISGFPLARLTPAPGAGRA